MSENKTTYCKNTINTHWPSFYEIINQDRKKQIFLNSLKSRIWYYPYFFGKFFWEFLIKARNPNYSLEFHLNTSKYLKKSSIAFEATLQVRNKVLKAYEEIMNMPV